MGLRDMMKQASDASNKTAIHQYLDGSTHTCKLSGLACYVDSPTGMVMKCTTCNVPIVSKMDELLKSLAGEGISKS